MRVLDIKSHGVLSFMVNFAVEHDSSQVSVLTRSKVQRACVTTLLEQMVEIITLILFAVFHRTVLSSLLDSGTLGETCSLSSSFFDVNLVYIVVPSRTGASGVRNLPVWALFRMKASVEAIVIVVSIPRPPR